jgi:hypothetical protein
MIELIFFFMVFRYWYYIAIIIGIFYFLEKWHHGLGFGIFFGIIFGLLTGVICYVLIWFTAIDMDIKWWEGLSTTIGVIAILISTPYYVKRILEFF